jgi:proteasome assembly chaperone (PAC2) family protein
MAEGNELRDPWLVAVWPGMGSVALLAGGYLVQQLEAQPAAELSAKEFFEVQDVEVKNGVAAAAKLPQSVFFEWRDPRGQRDLLIFVGQAQPASGGYILCQKLVDYAVQRGVRRFFTFAAMATQLQLGTKPRVYAVATNAPTLRSVRKANVEVLVEGQISGLNGVLLAAGAERGLQGACLLGELPFFAVTVPNPRAAKAVLGVFSEVAGLDIDFTDLDRQAKKIEQELKQLLERMSRAAGEAAGEPGEEWKDSSEDDADDDGDHVASAEEPGEAGELNQPSLDARTLRRIERLFDRAGQDRSKALELKHELDRLGVFSQYEDRFLDLFRKAE